MDEAAARTVLGSLIQPDGSLSMSGTMNYCEKCVDWVPGDETIVLADDFTLDELEAIVWWMRQHANREAET